MSVLDRRLGLRTRLRARFARRGHAPSHGHVPFDAERREAELYDAIYGQRTGTVENITPLARAAPGQQGRRGVEPARR